MNKRSPSAVAAVPNPAVRPVAAAPSAPAPRAKPLAPPVAAAPPAVIVATPSGVAPPPPAPARALRSSKKEKKEMPPARHRAVQCRRVVLRLQRLAHSMRGWTSVDSSPDLARDAVLSAARGLSDAAGFLDRLPADWKPTRAAGGSGADALRVGTLVAVRAKYAKIYEDILEPHDLTGLEVTALSRGGAVVCRSAHDGERLIFPRAHLLLAESVLLAAAADEDDAIEGEGDDTSFPTE